MDQFLTPVSRYMTTQVEAVGVDSMLSHVARRMDERKISAVPVVDAAGAVVGVLSRTDLLHLGRTLSRRHRGAAVMELPEQRAAEVIKGAPRLCGPDATLREAAQLMCEHHIHRLFVVDAGRLVGVISTLDLTAAVRDAKVETPLREVMSSPIITVGANQPVSVGIERLDRAHVTGLVVVDGEWPIGVFTQAEAMQSRDLPRDTPIDDLHDPSIICMPTSHRVRHAAAQAASLDVRRVIVCERREAVGVVTGLDFAKIVAA